MQSHRWWLAIVATLLTPWIGPHIDKYVPVGSLPVLAWPDYFDSPASIVVAVSFLSIYLFHKIGIPGNSILSNYL